MPNRTKNGRKRGIQRGVLKHKIQKQPRAKRCEDNDQVVGGGQEFCGIAPSSYLSLGRSCFKILCDGMEYCHLAPFKRTSQGQFVPLDTLKEKLWHCTMLAMMLALTVPRLWAVLEMLRLDELKIETFLCVSEFLVCFGSFTMSLGIWTQPRETMDLLNSWSNILGCLPQIQEGDSAIAPTPFDDVLTCIKIAFLLPVCQGIALSAALVNLIFSHLPFSVFATAERLDLIPPQLSWMPRIIWHVVFFPVE